MTGVWNKLTAHIGSIFHENKREPTALRPSTSLSALNQKNLKVVRPSKSTENLYRVGPESGGNRSKTWKKISSAKLFHFRSRTPRKELETEVNRAVRIPNGSFPLVLSASWHSNLAESCVQVPRGQTPNDYIHKHASIDDGAAKQRPKRARSISAQVRAQVVPRSTTPGFRTPQHSFLNVKNRTDLDARFLALNINDEDIQMSNNDFMYKRLETIGSGSYATVYKTQNRMSGQFFALKEIKLQPQEGLPFTAIREISLLKGLKHTNIIRLYQIVHQPHALVLIFEYMKTDLSKYMDNFKNGLDPFRTKLFLFQLLRGLAFCHERKILHRDLKPQNLLVSETGELKLADFGLARAQSVPSKTFSHDVVTLWYRPPDVLLGSTHYSTSLDMWGVGCIFAEMITGLAVFPGGNCVADQLDRIFSIRGLPQDSDWPEAKSLPKFHQYSFAHYSELSWGLVDPQLEEVEDNGADLLSSFLMLNPRLRISAFQAMHHEYFHSLPSSIHCLDPEEPVFNAFKHTII
ncbi:unnamed protein product [Bursaphelenchus xylophilus]|uniref:cyclin-dependent kinase n=1 Tax=Bursaphelenchus xylophilus TaxID=6326 RepID=A0A1I7S7A4_BURXY|nr:unnamed protein product [Bursaphelenchus xylophilus]CAG9084820.1 unnamed protein product [Bursaphelenchus xylophilus]